MPEFRILDSVETPIGVVDLRRRALPERPDVIATEITVDGDMLMSSLSTVSERALTERALALHADGEGLNVLVGGLGLGYTAHAALSDPRVATVRVVDRLPTVIDWMRRGLVPLAAELNAEHQRLEIVEGDVYAELLGAPNGRYDLILIDVDHAPSAPLDPSSEPFYLWHGQRQVAEHLAPRGVLAVWSTEDDDPFADVLAEVYPESNREHVAWTNDLIADGEEIDEVLFLARNS